MATRTAPAPAATPLLQPVRTGLLASAAPLDTPRWELGGVEYRPNTSDGGQSFNPCSTTLAVSVETEDPISWQPWGRSAASGCTALTLGAEGGLAEEDRVRQRYEAKIGHWTEQTFWTGILEDGTTFAASPDFNNVPLADPSAVNLTSTAAVGVVTAMNFAAEYLADTIGGLRGMIHVPAKLLPYIAFYGQAVRVQNLVLSALGDHIIVPGTGYDGSSPDGAPPDAGEVWIYVTSMVRAAASPPVVTSHLDHTGDNRWEAAATGLALAEWDLSAHAAIEVCIPDPGPDCQPGFS